MAAQTGPKNISVNQLKAALRKHAGVYTLAAQELGCDRSNIDQRVRRSVELQEFVAGIEEEIGDAAEAVIKSTIIQQSDKAASRNMAKWYAGMKLSGRGYRARQELTGADGAPIGSVLPPVNIVVQYVDAGSPGPATEEDVI